MRVRFVSTGLGYRREEFVVKTQAYRPRSCPGVRDDLLSSTWCRMVVCI
jgi:hypothetical protein